MRYELAISLRYLFSRRRKGFISFMSLISIIGIAVGVACLITVLAVMNGFGDELQKRIVGSNPHIVVEDERGIGLDNYRAFSGKIGEIKYVKGSYPYIWGQGVVRFRSRTQGVVIRSADTQNITDVSKLAKHICQGKLSLEGNEIILGNELATVLGVYVGDELKLTTPSRRTETFKVTGIFSSGMYEYDLNLTYVSLESASNLFDMAGMISGIGIDADSINKVTYVKEDLRGILPSSYYIRTWQDMNRNLFSALKLEKWAMFIILTLIIVVASLNIVSTLSIMVTQKSKDIGILKAVGATKRVIMSIYSLQGIIIGVFGAFFGALGGIGLSLLLKKYQFITLPRDVYYISTIPIKINMQDSFIIVVSAVIISFLASIYPAYQASRLNPVDALRYE